MFRIGIIGSGQAALALSVYFQAEGLQAEIFVDRAHPGCFKFLQDQIIVDGLFKNTFLLPPFTQDIEHFCKMSDLIFIVTPPMSGLLSPLTFNLWG